MPISSDRTGYRTDIFHAQVKQLFFAVCDLDRNIQRTRIEELCGDRPNLMREVIRLLEHDVDQELFDVEESQPPREPAGSAFHRFPLIDRVAESLNSKRNCGHVV